MAQPTPIEWDGINLLPTQEAKDKALQEIAQRPGVLPLDKRAWPYGKPDRLQPGNNF